MVLGVDGNFVLVRHGSAFYRCHPCQLMKVIPTKKETSTNPDKTNSKSESSKHSATVKNNDDAIDSSDSEDEDKNQVENDTNEETADDNLADEDNLENEEDENVGVDNVTETIGSDDGIENDNMAVEQSSDEDVAVDNLTNENKESEPAADETDNKIHEVKRSCRLKNRLTRFVKPKADSNIKFMLKDGSKGDCKVLSRQPKRTGSSKDWVNVKMLGDDEPSSIDWKEVSWWKKLDKEESVLILSSVEEYSQAVIDAKSRELKNLEDNKVFQLVAFVRLKSLLKKENYGSCNDVYMV